VNPAEHFEHGAEQRNGTRDAVRVRRESDRGIAASIAAPGTRTNSRSRSGRRVTKSESSSEKTSRSRSRSNGNKTRSRSRAIRAREAPKKCEEFRTKSTRKPEEDTGRTSVIKRTKAGAVSRAKSAHISPAKKRKKNMEQWEQDLDDIKTVLQEHFVVDHRLRDLIINSSDSIFSRFKSDRHPFHHKVSELLGLALRDLSAEAVEKKKGSAWVVENVDQTKHTTIERQDEIETELVEKEKAYDAKQEVKRNAMEAVRESESLLTDQKSDLFAKQTELGKAEQNFAADSKKADIFRGLKTQPSESEKGNKKTVAALTPFFKKLSMEASLLSAAPDALGHTLARRGVFDQSVIDEVTRVMDRYLFTREEEIGEHRVAKDELMKQADAAAEAHRVASEKLQKTDEEIDALEEEIDSLKVEKKKVAKTLKDFPKIAQQNRDDDENNARLITLFEESHLKFVALRDREREREVEPAAENLGAAEEAGEKDDGGGDQVQGDGTAKEEDASDEEGGLVEGRA